MNFVPFTYPTDRSSPSVFFNRVSNQSFCPIPAPGSRISSPRGSSRQKGFNGSVRTLSCLSARYFHHRGNDSWIRVSPELNLGLLEFTGVKWRLQPYPPAGLFSLHSQLHTTCHISGSMHPSTLCSLQPQLRTACHIVFFFIGCHIVTSVQDFSLLLNPW